MVISFLIFFSFFYFYCEYLNCQKSRDYSDEAQKAQSGDWVLWEEQGGRYHQLLGLEQTIKGFYRII